jgi:hypothetical protein
VREKLDDLRIKRPTKLYAKRQKKLPQKPTLPVLPVPQSQFLS